MDSSKVGFRTRIGGLLAAAGSAVGLGNIWRFPSETGEHGGAAFMIIYILFMLILGVPVMITELAIGRHGGKNVSHSFATMSGRKAWGWMGVVPVVGSIILLSYYSVVAGWTLEYLVEALTNQFAHTAADAYATAFNTFAADSISPIVCLTAMLLLTAAIVAFGVQRGIERAATIMMPVLFVCLLILVVCAVLLPGATAGLTFFLHPDFSCVTSGTILSAMGQAFFSLSLGVFVICTYGCYFRRDADLVKESLSVATIDTVVALMAGLIIFPTVFSIDGLRPDAGPGLVFITLPNVFQQVFALSPVVAYFFSLLFYFLLVVAALTSMISTLEAAAAIFIRKYKLRRPLVCLAIALICATLGALCSLSFGRWSGVLIGGMSIFDLFDFIVAKLIMPLSAFITCLFAGWVVDKKVLREEITCHGALRQRLYPIYRVIIRYVAPIGIALIFINELGLF